MRKIVIGKHLMKDSASVWHWIFETSLKRQTTILHLPAVQSASQEHHKVIHACWMTNSTSFEVMIQCLWTQLALISAQHLVTLHDWKMTETSCFASMPHICVSQFFEFCHCESLAIHCKRWFCTVKNGIGSKKFCPVPHKQKKFWSKLFINTPGKSCHCISKCEAGVHHQNGLVSHLKLQSV